MLAVVLVAIVAGLVIVAVTTDRSMTGTGRAVLVGLALIGLVAGVVLAWPRRPKDGDDVR